MADRGLGCLNRARKRTYTDRNGRRGVRPKQKVVATDSTSRIDVKRTSQIAVTFADGAANGFKATSWFNVAGTGKVS
jgi:hypothetical protein